MTLTLCEQFELLKLKRKSHFLLLEISLFTKAEEQDNNLLVIYRAMQASKKELEATADRHRKHFAKQIQKLGVKRLVEHEPYLSVELARYRLEFLEKLELLFSEQKSDDDRTTNVEEIITYERARTKQRLEQSLDEKRQRANGVERYVWRTAGDDKVRPSHAALEGTVFRWGDPDTFRPGQEYNCRCRAEPTGEINDPPINPVYPELYAIAAARMERAAAAILNRTRDRIESVSKPAEKPVKKPTAKPADGKNPPVGGRQDTQWQLGNHKSTEKWKNQMEQRGWDKKKIEDTIKYGKEYKAPNDIRKEPGASATCYEKDGKFVVRDDKTGDILQVSGDKFIPKELP